MPKVSPDNFTDLGVVSDRYVGDLIVRDSGNTVTFSVDVVADPCPNVTWIFDSIKLGPSNDIVTYNNPCMSADARSPSWTFTLDVRLLAVTSGSYSASFSNIAGTTHVHIAYLTIPGMSPKFISIIIEQGP